MDAAGVRAGALIGLAALALGFLSSVQLRAQLINPSNRLERTQALVRSVRELERENAAARVRITGLRQEIDGLEKRQAERSAETRRRRDEVASLRQHAGLTPLRGPGVTVEVANGRPTADSRGKTPYLVDFEDVQDVVNLLFAGGAEGVAVNGRRLTPLSSYQGSAGTVVIDQGPPLLAPFRMAAVGDRSRMEALLDEPSSLGGLRFRQRQYGVRLAWTGSPDVRLPAYDSSLEVHHARPG